jgi:NAD(P)-dependent dehydrogenase (short-subunit alcohol dehydrogenase family)
LITQRQPRAASTSEAESTVRQCVALGTKAFAVCGDVARDEACRATADATVKAFGRIDALINSAGTTKFAPMDDLDGQNAIAITMRSAYQPGLLSPAPWSDSAATLVCALA